MYVKAINNNSNFDDYLKLSINQNGELCYYLGILDNSNIPIKVKLTLKSKNQEIEKYIELNTPNSKPSSLCDDTIGYKYIEKSGIPIITMSKMYNINCDDNSTDLFSNSAITLKDKPLIILDIRGNSGGQDIAPMNWFKNFTGETPQIESSTIQLCSIINNYISKLAMKNIDYTSLSKELKEEYEKEMEKSSISFNKWYFSKTEEKHHNNNTKIFVLIDDKVSSSAESFISYLKTLENVVLVGTNTSGASISNVYTVSELPSSHITIKFGNMITITKSCKEGIGFKPDIWISNEDSLDKVLKLIKNLDII